MGTTTSLRQLLKCLCHNTHWKYAVLWKLKLMELTWEDCYFDNRTSAGFLNRNPERYTESGESVNFPFELAVANMSCRSFTLGEGTIGKVASERKHRWINASEIDSRIIGKVASERKHRWINASEIDSRLQEEFYREWNHQLVFGIKTILLVPVIPLGVVHLGSLDMILEDLREVICIRDHFASFQNTSETCTSLSPRMDQLASYTPLANLPLMISVKDQILGADIDPDANEIVWKSKLSSLFADHIEELPAPDQSLFADNTAGGDVSTFSFLDDEPDAFSSVSHRLISKHHTTPNPCIIDHVHQHHGYGKEFNGEEVLANKYLCFPSDSELHKALGLGTKGHEDCTWNAMISKADEWSSSIAYSKFEDANAWSRTESETEELLDAVIAKLLDTSDDNECQEPRCTRSCSNSSSKCSDSCLTLCKIEDDTLDLEVSESRSNKRSMPAFDNDGRTNSLSKSIIDMSSITEQDMVYELYKKCTKPTNVSRKRGNTADVRKPKPRDRQLIQERIKELRDLIPDGSKCSIDALLDRTVKHMLFLQSIPCQAENLRHSTEPKVNGKHWNSSEFPTCRNEASWSYNLGHGSEPCPLIVENLDQPGQIIVEMHCKDYGLFLEMAKIIRRLKLTILKGVLETKSSKPWACFILETPRGFHRTDIIWPLVQLLQRNNVSFTKMLY